MATCISTSFITYYLYSVMGNFVNTCIDDKIVDEMINLFLLLRTKNK